MLLYCNPYGIDQPGQISGSNIPIHKVSQVQTAPTCKILQFNVPGRIVPI